MSPSGLGSITGGYGCIGSWIAKNLLEQGKSVAIYDRAKNTKRMSLIMSDAEIGRIQFIEGDICDGSRVYYLDDGDLRAEIEGIPKTPLHEGIGQTAEIFRRLRHEGRLDSSDLE
jgi:NAD(P)-dependent dehydrogenase (short-subunit alcohol dehydrogenase family)